jgi:nucleotide-binding universal stress UspA family protein
VPALRQAADLTRRHDAVLIPLHAWVPPDGDRHERMHPCLELRQLWEDDAWQRLWQALDTALGGLPAGIRVQPAVRRGAPGKVLTGAARQPGDLLVIGSGPRGPLRRLGGCGVAAYCLAHASCPVVAVPPPLLAQEAGYGLRGWAFRHRRLGPDTAATSAGKPGQLPRGAKRWPREAIQGGADKVQRLRTPWNRSLSVGSGHGTRTRHPRTEEPVCGPGIVWR